MKRLIFLIFLFASFVYPQADNFDRTNTTNINGSMKWVTFTNAPGTIGIQSNEAYGVAVTGRWGAMIWDSLFYKVDNPKVGFIIKALPDYGVWGPPRAGTLRIWGSANKNWNVDSTGWGMELLGKEDGWNVTAISKTGKEVYSPAGSTYKIPMDVDDTIWCQWKGDSILVWLNSTQVISSTTWGGGKNPFYPVLQLDTLTWRIDDWFINTASFGGGGSIPIVTTDTVINIGYDSAMAVGSVNPRGLATTTWYSKSTDQLTWDSTDAADAGDGTVAVFDTAKLSGLSEGVQYYVRKMANNSIGTAIGSSISFTTLTNRDVIAPTITLTHDPLLNIDSTKAFQITFRATDAFGLDSMRIVVKNSAGATYDSIAVKATVGKPVKDTIIYTTPKYYSPGDYTYYARAKDDTGNVTNSSVNSFTVQVLNPTGSSFAVIGYYPFFSAPMYNPRYIHYPSLTHIIHFSTSPSLTSPYFLPVISSAESLNVEFSTDYYGNSNTPVQRILIDSSNLATYGVKVLLGVAAVGYYGGNVTAMINIVTDSGRTQTFVNSFVAYLYRKGYHGADFNWEWPDSEYRDGFSRLMRLMRQRLDEIMPVGRRILTYASNMVYNEGGGYQDLPLLNQYIDFALPEFYGTGWNQGGSVIGYSGALHRPSITGYDVVAVSDTNWYGVNQSSVYGLWQGGLNKSKIAPGFGLVYTYRNVTAVGQSQNGVEWVNSGMLCQGMADPQHPTYGAITELWDSVAKVNYKLWANAGLNYFMTYETQRSMTEKINWLKNNGYGGVMIYELGSIYIHTRTEYGGITSYTGDRDALLKHIGLIAKSGTVTIPDTVKIMFDGDSMTETAWTGGGYRPYVKQLLLQGGYSTDFVGSNTTTQPNSYTGGGTWNDFEHEGWGGTRFDQHIAWIRIRLTTYVPHIISIQMGTNDLNGGWMTLPVFASNVKNYLDTIWAVSPNLKVILHTIPPTDQAIWSVNLPTARIVGGNDSIKAIIIRKQNEGKYILLNDTYSAMTNPVAGGDLETDGVHIRSAGNSKWANALYPKLVEAINNITPPAVPSAPTLSTPANSATSIAVNTALTWSSVSTATSYAVNLDTVNTFDSGDLQTTTVSSPIIGAINSTWTNIANGQKYYWRVNATNGVGTSAWSSTFNFTTTATTPPATPATDYQTGIYYVKEGNVWKSYFGMLQLSQAARDSSSLGNGSIIYNTTTGKTNIKEGGVWIQK